MRRRIAIVVCLGLPILIAPVTGCSRPDDSPSITFAECESAGGVAWQVDLYHPDICPVCAEFQECRTEYDDYRDVCPDCYGPCQECRDRYSLHELCPECYGPCQECQNEYLNEFSSETERHELCPACRKCDECRERLSREVADCPPCRSCNECKEDNKKYSNIREVCPQAVVCMKCMRTNGPYPDACPESRRKIAQISDAATWFQCCK